MSDVCGGKMIIKPCGDDPPKPSCSKIDWDKLKPPHANVPGIYGASSRKDDSEKSAGDILLYPKEELILFCRSMIHHLPPGDSCNFYTKVLEDLEKSE